MRCMILYFLWVYISYFYLSTNVLCVYLFTSFSTLIFCPYFYLYHLHLFNTITICYWTLKCLILLYIYFFCLFVCLMGHILLFRKLARFVRYIFFLLKSRFNPDGDLTIRIITFIVHFSYSSLCCYCYLFHLFKCIFSQFICTPKIW